MAAIGGMPPFEACLSSWLLPGLKEVMAGMCSLQPVDLKSALFGVEEAFSDLPDP